MTKTLFSLANKYFREKDFQKAIELYLSYVKKDKYFFVYENLGMAYEHVGDLDKARNAYEKALNLNKNSHRAKFFLKESFEVRESKINNGLRDFHPVELIRQASRKSNLDFLKRDYFNKELNEVEDTFCLVRIIGNDLYPRHEKGQSRKNVKFILDNEPDYINLKKMWVVNRIVDADEYTQIIKMLKDYGQDFVEIPFSENEYKNISFDLDALPQPDFLTSKSFNSFKADKKGRLITAIYRKKNNYVMNNNGARNIALVEARKRAKWALPWDGNCYLTPDAWYAIQEDVTGSPWYSHFVVPMARMKSNEDLINNEAPPDPVEEPQLIFRQDSQINFNENFCYGRRPKVELFWTLGIPGKWDHWNDDPWDQQKRDESDESNRFHIAGWVARLQSGKPDLELASNISASSRNLARQEAIIQFFLNLDRKFNILNSRSNKNDLSSVLSLQIEKLAEELVSELSSFRGKKNDHILQHDLLINSLVKKDSSYVDSQFVLRARNEISHYVFMRFGIGIFDEKWLEHRLGLLESVAIPSIVSQKEVSFDLIIQVDRCLPYKYKKKLQEIVYDMSNVEVVELDLHADRYHDAKKLVNSRDNKGLILATRMDDDDALTEYSFYEIQKKAIESYDKKSKGVIAIKSGYRWAPSIKAVIKTEHKALGIGLTYFFKRGDFVNFYQNHMALAEKGESDLGEINYTDGHLSHWMYTTHCLQDTSVYDKIIKIKNSSLRIDIGDDFLNLFNIDVALLNKWLELEGKYYLDGDKKITDKIVGLERRIMRLRDGAISGCEADLKNLYKERLSLTQNLVLSRD